MSAAFRFSQLRFENQLDRALASMRQILHDQKCPQFVGDVPHSYEDKYAVVDGVLRATQTALRDCLSKLGYPVFASDNEQSNAVLRFESELRCQWSSESQRTVDSSETVVRESTLLGRSTTKVVKTVTEHCWKLQHKWSLSLEACGASKVLLARTGSGILTVLASAAGEKPQAPFPECDVRPARDLPLRWLMLSADEICVRRADPTCCTPRRNAEVDSALESMYRLAEWADAVQGAMLPVMRQQRNLAQFPLDALATHAEEIFVPSLPVVRADPSELSCASDDSKDAGTNLQQSPASTSTVVSASASEVRVQHTALLEAHHSSLTTTLAARTREFPPADAVSAELVSMAEVTLLLLLGHMRRIARMLPVAVDAIEQLLYRQLTEAVGHNFTVSEFDNFMQQHHQRVLPLAFRPKPFAFAVRRQGGSPEGMLSIVAASSSAQGPPSTILTLQRRFAAAAMAPMWFSINAGTRVVFGGDRVLHGWMQQRFADSVPSEFHLSVSARQYGCTLVLLGTVAPGQVFEPAHAVIVQNREEILVPLLLHQLPSAQAFRDAIHSLSPVQQRFARAVRAMQLESSLFGIAVIQLKPAMEKVLNLPEGALIKEITLTQQLLELFLEYQLPADLLSYEQRSSSSSSDDHRPVEQVRKHVTAMMAKIEADKAKLLAEQKLQEELAKAERHIARDRALRDAMDDHPVTVASSESVCELEGAMNYQSAPRSRSAGIGGSMRKLFGGGGGSGGTRDMMFSNAQSMTLHAAVSRKPDPSLATCSFDSAAVAPLAPMAATPSSTFGAPAAMAQLYQASLPVPAPASAQLQPKCVVTPPKADKERDVEQLPTPTIRTNLNDDSSVDDDNIDPIEWTEFPSSLDAACDAAGSFGASIRPTLVRVGDRWTRSQTSILSHETVTHEFTVAERKRCRDDAYHVLDTLSRSGVLTLMDAELHVVLAATHNFERSLIDTVVQQNVDPIAALVESMRLVASTVHQK